jgi:signal peptidase I
MVQSVDTPHTGLNEAPSSKENTAGYGNLAEERWPAHVEDVSGSQGSTNQGWAWARDVLETLLLAAVIFVLVNTLTGRYEVQSISMEPTLHEGQYLIVSKFAYWLSPAQRGDIVVLDPPDHRSPIPYIKRIIGLPGERVEVRNGRVWIDGVALNEPYVSGPVLYERTFELKSDEYLVLGDNRNNSSDSHVWGTLPEENLIGKTVFRYWPIDKLGLIPHYVFPELEEAP